MLRLPHLRRYMSFDPDMNWGYIGLQRRLTGMLPFSCGPIWNADQHSGAEGKARQLWTVVWSFQGR